ncbi:hypothetical protein ACFIJ5_17910 (plasmid) [Haloimpatiens sp. FM7330]|uniref:hypothetical protein n=1 Tax=Haloimpatiens sp. FM7330 TaxID=3298610 RepID=UPI0036284CE6
MAYNKENINTGEVISSKWGNKVEEGIYSAHKNIEGVKSQLADNAKIISTTQGKANSAYEKAEQAFQSASNGKNSIAQAITGKGVSANKNDTFNVLASKIGQISTAIKFNSDTPVFKTDANLNYMVFGKEGTTTHYYDIPPCKYFYFAGAIEGEANERNGYHDRPGESDVTTSVTIKFNKTQKEIQLMHLHVDCCRGYATSKIYGLTLQQGEDKSLLFANQTKLEIHNANEEYDMSKGIQFEFYQHGRGGATDHGAKMVGKILAY